MAQISNPGPSGSYQVFSPFTGTDSGCTNGVILLPPAFGYGQSLNLVVRFLYTGGSNFNQFKYQNSDFQFAIVQGQSQGNTTELVVSITILANNVWKCAQSARQALMNNFTDFITQIESKFEINSAPILIPGATAIIAGQIAETIPAPPLESLFYRYGFVAGLAGSGSPVVNLLPGMRLRVEFEASQYLSPGSQFNSYISSGQFYYYVCSVPGANNQRAIATDPFLGNIAAPQIPQSSSSPFLASGIIDLQSSGMPRRYYRIVYPQNMIAGNSAGDVTTAKNVALVGANSLADLNSGTGSTISTIFRGRAIVVPEIPVWINNQGQSSMVYVPVGTTVANILERFTAWKPIFILQSTLAMQRLQTATGTKTGNQGVSYVGLTFTTGVIGSAIANLQIYDLPLVGGDVVKFNFSAS